MPLKRISSLIRPGGREVPSRNPTQADEELCYGVVDSVDKLPGVSSRIGAVHLQLVHQPHELPDNSLPQENPPKSPMTLTARVSCQDQYKNLPAKRMGSVSANQPAGRQAPLTPIYKEEQHWNLIGLVGWWRRVEKEGEKEGILKDKERNQEGNRKRMVAAKISFLAKFYPDAHSSPGGNIRIVRDSNSDGVTGEEVKKPIDPETPVRISNKKHLPMSKRKSENIHTGESYSSPSKRQKLSSFSKKLQFW